MTQDPKTPHLGREAFPVAEAAVGYGQQVRGSRKGLGGDPPNGPAVRRVTRHDSSTPAPDIRADGPAGDVIPVCPLCHTESTVMSTAALSEGAYWRCTRCGQMWDAIRLQTAADYTRHVEAERTTR